MIPCQICRKEAERACSECGAFFCYNHGGPAKFLKVHRWVFWRYWPWLSLEKRYCCNLCRPNQKFQRTAFFAYWGIHFLFVAVLLYFAIRYQ